MDGLIARYTRGSDVLDNIRKDLEVHFTGLWDVEDAKVSLGSGALETINLRDADLPVVRMMVEPGLSINTGVRGCVLRTGFTSVFIYAKHDKGAGISWRLAEKVKNIFENKRINRTVTFETSVYDRGELANTGIRIFEASTSYEAEE